MTSEMIQNIIDGILPWWGTVQLLFYIIGFCFVIFGMIGIPQGRQNQFMNGNTSKRSCLTVLAGLCLLNLPGLMDAINWSIFGENSMQELSYEAPSEDIYGLYIRLAVYTIMLVGLVGLGKGVMTIRQQADNPYTLGKALCFMVGGTLAVNILALAKTVGVTVGGDVDVIITNFFNLS